MAQAASAAGSWAGPAWVVGLVYAPGLGRWGGGWGLYFVSFLRKTQNVQILQEIRIISFVGGFFLPEHKTATCLTTGVCF